MTGLAHECLASKRGLLRPWSSYGLDGPLGICLHTTGVGVLARAKREGTTPMQAALKVYCQIMEPSPHVVIGHDGDIEQVCDYGLVAWHAGHTRREQVLYHSPKAMRVRPWWKEWVTRNMAATPLRIADPSVDHTGNCCLGAELIPLPDKTFTAEQYTSVRALREVIRGLFGGIVADSMWQHSDFCPETRTTRKGESWDLPESFDWMALD